MADRIRMEGIWRGAADCRSCAVRGLALFADFKDADFDMIHAPIDHLAYRPGSVLYQEGARAPGILSVRSGMLKLVRTSPDGRQRIVRVLRPGDVAGLEALATSHYDNEAVALSDVAVCRIPLDVIHTLGSSTPRLQMRLMQKWQQALKGADDWIAELNFGTARQRVSNLILRMRHPDGDDTVTLFARDDMGAMLDLKLETVSREVSRLVREEVIEPLDKQGRRYRLREPARLLSV